MSRLKLHALDDDKPVKVAIELPAAVHRDLVTYASLLSSEANQPADPVKLISPMLARFMASDRAFKKARKAKAPQGDLTDRAAAIET